jgi:hypothetical protein
MSTPHLRNAAQFDELLGLLKNVEKAEETCKAVDDVYPKTRYVNAVI